MMTHSGNIFVLSIVFMFSCSALLSLLFSFLSMNAKYAAENRKLLHFVRGSGLITLLSPLLNCVLSETHRLRSAMEAACLFYTIFAAAWLIILVLGVLISLIERLLRKENQQIRKCRRGFYAWHCFAFLFSVVFAWLFS